MSDELEQVRAINRALPFAHPILDRGEWNNLAIREIDNVVAILMDAEMDRRNTVMKRVGESLIALGLK